MKKRWGITTIALLISTRLAYLYHLYKDDSGSGRKKVQAPYMKIRERVVDLLRKHSSDCEFDSELLLKRLGEPRDSVESAFHLSVDKIITEYRIVQVEVLLRSTEDSISSIAKTVGFRSSKDLCDLFIALYGVEPTVYREKQKG